MNLNQEQLEHAVERGQELCAELTKDYPELRLYPVFCRFGPGSGQCELTTNLRKIMMALPSMLVVSSDLCRLKTLLADIQKAEINEDTKVLPKLRKEAEVVGSRLLDSDQPLYCGKVNIEFRTGVLKYEPLQRLQQDPRLQPGLNTVGNIRVIAGSLEYLLIKVGIIQIGYGNQ